MSMWMQTSLKDIVIIKVSWTKYKYMGYIYTYEYIIKKVIPVYHNLC